MELLTTILLLLTASYLLSEAFISIQFPRVLGPIIVGLALGAPGVREALFDTTQLEVLASFAQLGLIFLMFYTGLELDVRAIAKQSRNALTIICFSFGVPFLVGTTTLHFGFGVDWGISLLIGALIAISAEAVAVDILSEMRLLTSRVGQLIVSIGTMDDVVELLALGIIVALIAGSAQSLPVVALHILIFFSLIYVSRYLVVPLVLKFVGKQSHQSELLIVSMIMVLFLSVASEFLFGNVAPTFKGVGVLVGAIVAGTLVKYSLIESKEERERSDITSTVETLTFGFFAPFFFISIGMEANIGAIMDHPAIGLALLGIVMILQPLGAAVGNRLSGNRFSEGLAVGLGVTTKGGLELIAATLLLQSGLITEELFSAFIFMAFFAMILSPILFKLMARHLHLLGQTDASESLFDEQKV